MEGIQGITYPGKRNKSLFRVIYILKLGKDIGFQRNNKYVEKRQKGERAKAIILKKEPQELLDPSSIAGNLR